MRVITSSRRIMIFKLTVLVLAALFLLFPVISTAYADNGISTSSAEWKSKIVEIGGIYETLTLAGGAVGLAWCGLEYTYGSDDLAKRAKAKAIIIAFATAALFLLPRFIALGMSVGRAHSWSPESLK